MESWKINLLKLIAKYEYYEAIWWNTDLEFFVNCNDEFAWGCADAEKIEESDLDLFKRSCEDSKFNACSLFTARKRKMRPQGALYQHIEKSDWHLFDACGPEREVGIGNPQPHP